MYTIILPSPDGYAVRYHNQQLYRVVLKLKVKGQLELTPFSSVHPYADPHSGCPHHSVKMSRYRELLEKIRLRERSGSAFNFMPQASGAKA